MRSQREAAQHAMEEPFARNAKAASPPLLRHPYAIVWLAAVALTLMTANECRSVGNLPSLLYGAVLWGWWGAVSCTLWALCERRLLPPGMSLRSLALNTLAAAGLGWAHLVALWSLGLTGLGWYAHLSPQLAWRSLVNLNRWGAELLVYGFVFAVVSVVQFERRSQQEALRAAELERQLSAAQLRALQMQLEPHFLLNTLNAITTLVELGRQAEAAAMLSHLNVILKSTLKRTAPEKVPLSQELEMIENYLAIEQVRFADRLRVEVKVEPGALDSMVPCFLLQPLVENAICHGIAHCEHEGTVEACARREDGRLWLEVRNSGSAPTGQASPGNGIGLKNTRERLEHFYQDRFQMTAEALTAGGFEVAIRIPYERC